MSIAIAARFARRELRGGLKGFTIFLSCLALGVAAIAAVGSVRNAIETGLSVEGAALLGGDAELDFTYHFANAQEKEWMQSRANAVSEIAEFRSMAVVDNGDQTGDTSPYYHGETVSYTCNTGYTLVGSSQIYCTDGNWNDTVPECKGNVSRIIIVTKSPWHKSLRDPYGE